MSVFELTISLLIALVSFKIDFKQLVVHKLSGRFTLIKVRFSFKVEMSFTLVFLKNNKTEVKWYHVTEITGAITLHVDCSLMHGAISLSLL